jgi:predicted RecA/RadA family phage recombinase
MNNYVQRGEIIPLTAPSGGVVSGNAYKIGALVVVACVSAAQTLPFSAMTRGVHVLPKATGQTWSEGAVLYWDNSAAKFTTTSGGNTLAGHAARAALTGDTTGYVRLDGVAR